MNDVTLIVTITLGLACEYRQSSACARLDTVRKIV